MKTISILWVISLLAVSLGMIVLSPSITFAYANDLPRVAITKEISYRDHEIKDYQIQVSPEKTNSVSNNSSMLSNMIESQQKTGLSSSYDTLRSNQTTGAETMASMKKKQSTDDYIQGLIDNGLAEKILPLMINRIDSSTILENVNGRELLTKIFPYLDVKVTITPRVGESGRLNEIPSTGSSTVHSIARCQPGEIPVSGGYFIYNQNHPFWEMLHVPRPDEKVLPADGWYVASLFTKPGSIQSVANCLDFEIGIKPFPVTENTGPVMDEDLPLER